MQTVQSSDVPDRTYFRTGDVSPHVDDDTITVYDGYGTRRSTWGAPGVTSTVVWESPNFVVVHVGFFHKHGGGQFWRYYTLEDGTISRRTYRQLNDGQKAIVAESWTNAPSWAKAPAKSL